MTKETEFRPVGNSKEHLARMIAGPDSTAEFHLQNVESAERLRKSEQDTKFNQSIEELQNKFQENIDAIQELGKSIAENLEHLEIMPLTSYVLITPYKKNPFLPIIKKGNLLIGLDGMAPTYKNQENGNIEEEKEYVKVGMVTEVGTECKFLKPGDIVFYNVASEVQVPFFRFGFVIVAEQRIIAVVNDNLTKRKEDILNNANKKDD